tara:strand:- start:301 stop:729 length:429 start_codon:yes stop_codon:yes gene_type:complete
MIRTMQKNDINAVRKVYSDTRRSEFKWLKDNHLDLSDFDKDTEGEKILVALENSQVVGFISIWEADSFIHHLFVLPEFSNRGYGSQLLSAGLDTISLPAQLKCVSENKATLEFYLRRGWYVVSKGVSGDGEYKLMQIDKKLS